MERSMMDQAPALPRQSLPGRPSQALPIMGEVITVILIFALGFLAHLL